MIPLDGGVIGGNPRIKDDEGKILDVTDEMIERLLHNDEALKIADNKRKSLSKEQIYQLRVRCKRDLFFFAYAILGYTRLSVNLHGHFCTHLKNTEHKRFRGILMPRGNFKSTIVTIADSIQKALPYTLEDAAHDDDKSELSWPAILGVNIRLLIAHETHESAARFLYSITNHVTNNPLLMALFPEMVPSPRKQRINKHELELPRSITGSPEPTFDTLGVGGKSQGRHYNFIKLDDIYGDKARDSETEAQATRDWFDNIQPFFDTFKKDHLDLIGTRYSFDDIYNHAMERYGDKMVWYIRKLEEVQPDGTTQITFPEEFDNDSIEVLKKNKKVYAAQYQNDPQDSKHGFNPNWRKYFNWLSRDQIVIFRGTHREVIQTRDLDLCILIDPGESRSGAYVITGMDYRGNVYILSAQRLEIDPPTLTDLQFTNVRKWTPRTTAIESDFFMATFQHWWRDVMKLRGLYFHITPVYTKKREKNDRISGLTNYWEGGRIYHNIEMHDLEREYRTWGKSKDIHILDALAYGPEVWRPGYAPGMRELMNQSQAQNDDRDALTGYSS